MFSPEKDRFFTLFGSKSRAKIGFSIYNFVLGLKRKAKVE